MSDRPEDTKPLTTQAHVTATQGTRTDDAATQVRASGPAVGVLGLGLPEVRGYAVACEIARGGMGAVYRARDAAFDREVAVKVMHPGQDAGRFVVEARVTAQLAHPGVPPVHDLGMLPDGRPFLAMKLIVGRTLAGELDDRTRADLPGLLVIFERICETVGYAHARGIIHRDLKPTNVMVGAFGEVQVMDWGLAREVKGTEGAARNEETIPDASGASGPYVHETQAGEIKGTPAYMAPEQARGESVDARADVFALGGILAAMLTGKPPFGGSTVLETVLQAAEANLTPCFGQLDSSGADAELVTLAKKCLAPAPADRFASGEEVAFAVAEYRRGVEERLRAAERDRAAAEVEARAQKKQKRQQILAVAVVAGVMAAAGVIHQEYQRREDQRAAELQLADARAEADRQEYQRREEQREAQQRLADARAEADRRATESRLAGERDAEARNKAEQARTGVAAALDLATRLRTQAKFKEAGAALTQALALAKGGAPERVADVERAQIDLALVARLDDVRFRKWAYVSRSGGRSGYSTGIASPEYRKAFTGYGLDVAALAPAEAASRVGASAVKAELVAALDDWATYEPDATVRDRVLEVARRADPGSWTDRLRTPDVRAERSAVAELAATVDAAAAQPASLCVLGALMTRNRLDPTAFLSAARTKHPGNFELAFALSRVYLSDAAGRQFGPLEAALAVRPDSAIVWTNLGAALAARGDRDGAIGAWREAVRHDPTLAQAHSNLGGLLPLAGKLDEGLKHCREAVRLDPTDAYYRDNLGLALLRKSAFNEAEAAFKEAARLDPTLAAAVNNLGSVYLATDRVAEGIACAREAIRIDPKYSNAYAMLGDALRQTGDIAGARAALTEAARLDKRWGNLLAQLPPVPVAPEPKPKP